VTEAIVHVHTDQLEWEPLGSHGLRCKMLSRDPANGGWVNIVDIPRNWRGGGVAHYHDAFEEVYILSGEVTLGAGRWFRAGDYFYRPAQVVHGHGEYANGGCVSLTRCNGPLTLNLVHEPTEPDEYPRIAGVDPRGHTLQLPTETIEWTTLPELPKAWRARMLSRHPSNGAMTAMVDIPAGWTSDSTLDHEGRWLTYILAGSLEVGDRDVFEASHFGEGPSRTGPLGPGRSVGGCRLILWLEPTAAA
jgi:hypothetical protein